MKIVRSIAGVVVGLIVAFLLIGVVEISGHLIFPPPPGIDLHNPEALRTIISKLPMGAIVAVLVGWACGSFGGAFVAGLIAGRSQFIHAFVVGGLLMAIGIYTMIVIPHPWWFVIAAINIFVAFTSLGAKLARRYGRPPRSPGPKPYDMRERNMAC